MSTGEQTFQLLKGSEMTMCKGEIHPQMFFLQYHLDHPLSLKPELCVSFELDIKLCMRPLVLRLVVRLYLLLSDVIVVRWKK